ncbi:RNA polymerase sigma factor [Mucilaginibacter aquaedulcis]|uniref:RNA polymerase sigma factor n=1 Tax=Mucilaginibacter aquaedulcis TaxID=1187081 RepID=UPI0025B2CD3B|nr:RNA polymerase sigma factor [Mucilaginibacter aquaedulcis]MDN3548811.1 RNA polymerase sigma factor [Mucilaginibacter aquaedulcis]
MPEYNNDEILICAVLSGSRGAFAQLIDNYQGFAFNLAMKFTGNNRELSEEITQDVFIKVLNNLKSYRNKSRFSTWMYRIIFNTAMTELRKTNKLVFFEKLEDEFDIPAEEDYCKLSGSDKQLMKIQIANAIKNLSHVDGLIIELYYFQDQTIDEICLILELRKENIKSRLFRARQKLREQLSGVYKSM